MSDQVGKLREAADVQLRRASELQAAARSAEAERDAKAREVQQLMEKAALSDGASREKQRESEAHRAARATAEQEVAGLRKDGERLAVELVEAKHRIETTANEHRHQLTAAHNDAASAHEAHRRARDAHAHHQRKGKAEWRQKAAVLERQAALLREDCSVLQVSATRAFLRSFLRAFLRAFIRAFLRAFLRAFSERSVLQTEVKHKMTMLMNDTMRDVGELQWHHKEDIGKLADSMTGKSASMHKLYEGNMESFR